MAGEENANANRIVDVGYDSEHESNRSMHIHPRGDVGDDIDERIKSRFLNKKTKAVEDKATDEVEKGNKKEMRTYRAKNWLQNLRKEKGPGGVNAMTWGDSRRTEKARGTQ
ncbi:hypothetical protein L1987_23807 [Smallanthus sonchifolius]|uniref:Uncharacterized protein n=1 Tax=Smallanthus sonchifolius TaxID=185202 RepID=A0ACB9IK57_9ASTR|nr:hypothetical protein L1987_23807 [Smallanthus sonchifolius]